MHALSLGFWHVLMNPGSLLGDSAIRDTIKYKILPLQITGADDPAVAPMFLRQVFGQAA